VSQSLLEPITTPTNTGAGLICSLQVLDNLEL